MIGTTLPFIYASQKIKICETILLSVVLYDCETCLLQREEYRLSVNENRIRRRIFVPKEDENVDWITLHNEEFHSLYPSSNIVRVIKSK